MFDQLSSKTLEFINKGNIDVKFPVASDFRFMISCISEEIEEYMEALSNSDKGEMFDALIDIVYFCFFMSHQYGFTKSIKRYHSKIKGALTAEGKTNLPLTHYLAQLGNHHDPIKPTYYKVCAELIEYCIRKGNQWGDFQAAFNEVHEANMRKYTTNASNAIIGAGMAEVKKGVKGYWEKKDNYYIVYAIMNGRKRILKPLNWVAPNVQQFLK